MIPRTASPSEPDASSSIFASFPTTSTSVEAQGSGVTIGVTSRQRWLVTMSAHARGSDSETHGVVPLERGDDRACTSRASISCLRLSLAARCSAMALRSRPSRTRLSEASGRFSEAPGDHGRRASRASQRVGSVPARLLPPDLRWRSPPSPFSPSPSLPLSPPSPPLDGQHVT